MGKVKIERVAIANRGEVALRIIRACQEMGLETILLHSSVDEQGEAFRTADHTVCIGGAAAQDSYLNIAANVQGALSAAADAIHPGFGFLSENAEFAEAVIAAGMVFVGPTPANIRLFGDKISAKKQFEKNGGPTIPGYSGSDQSITTLVRECERIGYPVMCKAAGGGGGRGLKVIHNAFEAADLIQSAQREALSAFGSQQVFLEKYFASAKHIEVQVFGDCGGRVHILGERECSVQRRHQKIIEEALSPSLDLKMRQALSFMARDLTARAGYVNAGTVEFLLQDGKFYFMEMNTRLQVEHPVTELVFGIDLVKAQLLTAMGQPLAWPNEFTPHGHALECRIYAEDPYHGGIPSTGKILFTHWPQGPGRRFEVGFAADDEITPHYDSMIAKIIVWDETRIRAIQKMKATLRDTIIFGVRTNIPLLQEILSHEEFLSGRMTTRFFEQHFGQPLAEPSFAPSERAVIDSLNRQISVPSAGGGSESDPWSFAWDQT